MQATRNMIEGEIKARIAEIAKVWQSRINDAGCPNFIKQTIEETRTAFDELEALCTEHNNAPEQVDLTSSSENEGEGESSEGESTESTSETTAES